MARFVVVLCLVTIGSAVAATAAAQESPTADLAIVSNTASAKHAKVGSEVTFTIVAANNGPDASELDVMWTSDQMQLVSETCEGGISPDTPSCEYSLVEPGQTRTTVVVAEVTATDSKHAVSTVCVTSQFGFMADPNPENNCAAATVKIVGPRRVW